jgi:lysophospholipase L1-like esterase
MLYCSDVPESTPRPKRMKPVIYLALGDSISIDDYPDEQAKSEGNGAASLLAKKLEAAGMIKEFHNYTADGATISNIYHLQLVPATKHIDKNEELLITLTAGGNDVSFKSMRLRAQKNVSLVVDDRFDNMMTEIMYDYANLVIATRKMFPNSVIVLNTLYDPTDGTGTLPKNCGMWADIAPLYSRGRRELGQFVKNWSKTLKFALLADIFQLFNGHGMSTSNNDRMYYEPFLIEPGVAGARKIANLWYFLYTLHLDTKSEECRYDRSNQAAAERTRLRQV